MKKIFYVALSLLPLVFASCDNIENEEKLVYPEGQTNLTTPITNTTSVQRVLLEDYTGWNCVNCPRAAAKATTLLNQYADSLVVMAVHCGTFAKPRAANNNLDFRTEYGEKWYVDFGLVAFPAGVINRIATSGVYNVSDNSWETTVASRFASAEHTMDINLGATYKSAEKKILVSTQNVFLKDVSFPTLINIVVVESGLHGLQANANAAYGSTPTIPDYTFNHVLRKNGLVDYSLSSLAVSGGTTLSKNYLLSLDKDIKDIANCKVIVFVTNANTKEVVQVNEVDIK